MTTQIRKINFQSASNVRNPSISSADSNYAQDTFKTICSSWYLRWILLLVLVTLCGCAARPTYFDDTQGGEMVFHSFAFDARRDSPGIEIIDFRYGTAKVSAVQNRHEDRAQGKSDQSTGSSGRGLRGTELYVKWRIKSTGEVIEDRVDLKSRQPASIEGSEVYFVIEEKKLHIYMISSEFSRPLMTIEESEESVEFIRKTPFRNRRGLARNNVVQIYPDRIQIFPFYSKKSTK